MSYLGPFHYETGEPYCGWTRTIVAHTPRKSIVTTEPKVLKRLLCAGGKVVVIHSHHGEVTRDVSEGTERGTKKVGEGPLGDVRRGRTT